MDRRPINEHFFDGESKEIWYVIGVSYGRYFPSRQGTLNTWSSSSLNLIKIIKRELGSGHKIIIEKRTGTYKLRMWDGHLQLKLFERGCVPGKKNRTFPENIEEQYLDHFIRGFFDANVSCSTGNRYRYDENWLVISYPSVKFLQGLYSDLVSHATVKSGRKITKSPLNLSNQDSIAVHNFIYRDWIYIQEHGLYLPSKKERFKI